MRTLFFVCLLCGVWTSPIQAFSSDSDVFEYTFHVKPPIAESALPKGHDWLQSQAVQWAGQWQVFDTPTTESVIGVEASYLEMFSPNPEDAPVIYEFYYQHQWHNRYLVKPQIQLIRPQDRTLSTKEALIFSLSTEISF